MSHVPTKPGKRTSGSWLRTAALYTLAVAAVAGAGYLGYRYVLPLWRDGTLGERLGLTSNADGRPAEPPVAAATIVRTAARSVPAVYERPVGLAAALSL
jgi:hypothetical protein